MRENTGRRTVTTTNFVVYHNRTEAASSDWTSEQAETAEWTIRGYADAHLESDRDANGYRVPVEVWEYEVPGLLVFALVESGIVVTVFVISEDDLARVHTALRTGREMTIRYVKESGEVSRRRVRPQSLVFTKGRDYLLRAEDDRRDGDSRSFRWDRVTHTTLHRRIRRAAPSKAALVSQAAASLVTGPAPVTGRVVHPRYGFSGTVQDGTQAFSPSGWSVIVRLDEAYAHLSVGGTTRVSEAELKVIPAGMVAVPDWNGAPKLITREAYARLLEARDPREPKAADGTLVHA